MSLSIGKLRGLQQCASPRGTFTFLALDHRQNLRKSLNPENPSQVSDAELTDFKLNVTRALAGQATAVLLDPEFSAAQAVAAGVVPGDIGLVVAVESTGYTGDPTARKGQILPGWSVEKAKRMGASMIKLLVYYHPDSPTAGEIEAFVSQVASECRRYDLGMMLEPLSYSLDPDQKLSSAQKRYVVTETARRLSPLGPDILKSEFPVEVKEEPDQKVWEAACADITRLSPVPWIVLSAAVDYDVFLRQVTVACQAGASGTAVGRAVWKEAVALKGEEQKNFLENTAKERLQSLTALCVGLAKPYQEVYPAELVAPDWYQQY